MVRGKREEMYSTGRSSSWSGLRQSCVRGVAAGGLVDCWLFGGLDVSRPVILTYTDELTRAAPLHSQRSMSLVRSTLHRRLVVDVDAISIVITYQHHY